MAAALVMQPVASLRMEFIIPITADQEGSIRRYRVGVATAIGMSCTLGVAALLTGRLVTGSSLPVTLGMTSLLLFVNAWSALDNARLIRRSETSRLALRNLLSGILSASLQLTAALMQNSILWIAVAVLIGRAISILVTNYRNSVNLEVQRRPDTADPVYGGRRVLTTISAGVLSNASVHGLSLLIAAFYNPYAVGQVGVAQRITASPIGLIGQAISQSFQTTASRAIRERSATLETSTRSFAFRLALTSSPFAVALAVIAPLAAVPVLGDDWQDAGWVIAILSAPMALQLAIAPTVSLLVMLNREALLFRLQLLRVVAAIAGCGIPALMGGGYLYSCAGFAVSTSVAYLLTAIISIRTARLFDASCRA